MKRVATIVPLVLLLTAWGCKHKEEAPAPAASVSTTPALSGLKVAPPITSEVPSVGDFEGEIALLAKGKFSGKEGTPLNLSLLIKDRRVRVDVPESLTGARGLGPVHLLALPADKKLYAILDGKKQAVLLELDKLAEQAKAFGGRPPSADAPSTPSRLEKTGKFETVAGIKCEVWHFSQAKNQGDACIAEQDAAWLRLPIDGAPTELSWLSPIADGKHFPLRFVSTEGGVERGSIEVVKLQQKPLPASEFELPAGYAVLSLEQMIGSMLGGFGGPGMQLPPGLKLPPGVKLPPRVKSPPSK